MSEADSDCVREALADLRAEVPVRPEWRASLLHAIADEVAPKRDLASGESSGRRITLRPLAAAAAALAFAAIGALTTFSVVSTGERGRATVPSATAVSEGQSASSPLVRFVLVAPSASRVSLVGNFNRWDPQAIPLRAERSGVWTVSVRLPPGRHVYAFVVDGDIKPDPTAPRAAEEDFGTPSSVVVVNPNPGRERG